MDGLILICYKIIKYKILVFTNNSSIPNSSGCIGICADSSVPPEKKSLKKALNYISDAEVSKGAVLIDLKGPKQSRI